MSANHRKPRLPIAGHSLSPTGSHAIAAFGTAVGNHRKTNARGFLLTTKSNRKPTSSYAKYVGRVGALAVALGVSGAVATTPGVAWADDSPTAPSSDSGAASTPASSSGSDQTTTSTSLVSTGPSTDPTTQSPPASPSADRTSGDAAVGPADEPEQQSPTLRTVTSDDSRVTYSSSGGAHTSGAADTSPSASPLESAPTDGADLSPDDSGSAPPFGADEALAEPVHPTDGDDPTAQEPPDTQATTQPLDEGSNVGLVTLGPASDLRDASRNTDSDGVQSFSSADDGTLRLLTAAPSQAPNWTNQLGTAFALPTPEAIVKELKPKVTACVCGFINRATSFLNTVLAPLLSVGAAGAAGPAAPAESPMMWALVGWVRRQVTQAVNDFMASPLGRPIAQIIKAVDDFGDSPLGRQFGAQINQALRVCGPNASLPADFDRITIVSGLNEPTDFKILTTADGKEVDRIFIAEKGGAIKVYDPATGSLTTLTMLPTVTGGERGLAGIELHPNFGVEGKEGSHTMYAAYTSAANRDTLSLLTVSESWDSVDVKVLIESTEQANNFHHGGELSFDPEGKYLYWSVGDNTDGLNAQDLTNIHGKVLRLNPDGSVPQGPEGNPFVRDPTAVGHIYAYGFRNPFRFTFTPTGELLVADVGEADWEELNLVTAGANYGWPGAEGSCTGCSSVNPLYAYRHSAPPANAGSITSVAVYTGDTFPESYQNTVFIADYSIGWIKVLKFDSAYSSLISTRTFWGNAGATVKLGQGPDGDLYQLTIYPGELSIITPSGGNRAPTAIIGATATNTAAKSLEVDFSALSSIDPDGDNLTYHWNFGDGGTSTAATPTRVFTTSGAFSTYTVTLTVSDGAKTSKATQRITVGSTPPTAEITVGGTYNAGDTIVFSGKGSDAQDVGTLPNSAYKWTVAFHHADHTHPFRDNIVGPTGSITIPRTRDQLSNTFYRITLTVTDSSGLSTSQSKDVMPNLVPFTVSANNPEAKFTIDGLVYTGSFNEMAVVGVEHVLDAPSPQYVNGSPLIFGTWSDGHPQSHTITIPASNASYSVTYVTATPALSQEALSLTRI